MKNGLFVGSVILALSTPAHSEIFQLRESSMISSEGILSTKSPTIYLDGAMEMLNGTITQAITLCSNGECDNVFLSGTFKPYATNIMEITDQSGALSLMVIVNKDPLITHTLNASYTEVDV